MDFSNVALGDPVLRCAGVPHPVVLLQDWATEEIVHDAKHLRQILAIYAGKGPHPGQFGCNSLVKFPGRMRFPDPNLNCRWRWKWKSLSGSNMPLKCVLHSAWCLWGYCTDLCGSIVFRSWSSCCPARDGCWSNLRVKESHIVYLTIPMWKR